LWKRFVVKNPCLLFGRALVGVWLAFLSTGRLEGQPRSGTYQITAGTYVEIGGFASLLRYQLPDGAQGFVQLSVPAGAGSAEMTILSRSLHQTFLRTFTNGIVSSNQITFRYNTVHPWYPSITNSAMVDYIVTTAGPNLFLQGTITASDTICCDVPYRFEHSNVTATTAPRLSIRLTDQVELRWNAQSNQAYQIQYRTALTNGWLNLTSVPARSPTNYWTERPVGVSQRFYRVVEMP
jgi:hypothetical protein